MSTCSRPPTADCAGAAAVAAPADDGFGEVATEATSGSRIRAPSPLPNAFLAICDDLLCKISVGFRSSTMNVVEVDRLPVTGRFRQPDIPRNDGLENLASKEAPEI